MLRKMLHLLCLDIQLLLPSHPPIKPRSLGRAVRFVQPNLHNVFSHLASKSAEQDRPYKDIINIELTKEQQRF